ncbi:MAG: flavodoxin-dependent (E)-4-hydroxy-3-methylbut-2-enyl-diphosphate synthase, partial [Candidatus Moraniibacteriota bacterium]
GTLLLDGVGDTIRVSLTEDPVKEIPTCYGILQAARRRITRTEFISCPSCGRTLYDLETVTNVIKERMGHLKGVRIAIMGCIVNGLGEMADADFGYVGGARNKVNLYHKKELVKRDVPSERAVDELVLLIKAKGMWIEPRA